MSQNPNSEDAEENVTISPDIATQSSEGRTVGGGQASQQGSLDPRSEDPDYALEIKMPRRTINLEVGEGEYVALTNVQGEEIAYVAVEELEE